MAATGMVVVVVVVVGLQLLLRGRVASAARDAIGKITFAMRAVRIASGWLNPSGATRLMHATFKWQWSLLPPRRAALFKLEGRL